MKNLFIFLWIAFGFSQVAIAQEDLQFPLKEKGIAALKELVTKSGQDYAVHYQAIKYKEGTEFLIVNHNIGSGLVIMNVYVYLCGKGRCEMVTMRSAVNGGLLAELTPDGKELILKSEKGAVYLRMPFNWPRPPKEN